MKKLIILAVLIMFALAGYTQPYYVNLVTPTPHPTTNTGTILIPGQFTNSFTEINPNNIQIGDSLPIAFNKLNQDIYWLFLNGGNGGVVSNGVYVLEYSGGASNLTVTNSFTLTSTTPYYIPSYTSAGGSVTSTYNIFNSISVTGLVTSCITARHLY